MKRLWWPDMWQVKVGENDSWCHSAFVGVTAAFINLPYSVWALCLRPFFKGLYLVAWSVVMLPLLGLAGRVVTIERTFTEAVDEVKRQRGD